MEHRLIPLEAFELGWILARVKESLKDWHIEAAKLEKQKIVMLNLVSEI